MLDGGIPLLYVSESQTRLPRRAKVSIGGPLWKKSSVIVRTIEPTYLLTIASMTSTCYCTKDVKVFIRSTIMRYHKLVSSNFETIKL